MKKATVAAFLLLSVLMAFGRNVTDQEIAVALKRALRARDNLTDAAEVQVSSALSTGKDICIEYRASSAGGQSISGLAVYRTEDELVFLDNSWIWERACLSGKYGQKRNGKDLTHSINAVLAAPMLAKPAVMAAVAAPAPVVASAPVQPVVAAHPVAVEAPAPIAAARASAPPAVNVQQPPAPTPPAAVIAAAPPVAPVVAPAAPVAVALPAAPPVVAVGATLPSAPMPKTPAPAQTTTVATALETPSATPATTAVTIVTPKPAPSIPAPVTVASSAAAAPAPPAPHEYAMSAPPAVATIPQPAPVIPAVSIVASNRAASTETPLHGVTIIDNDGALGPATSTGSPAAPVESLADAARRVRRNR
jgi:hypothetical protein